MYELMARLKINFLKSGILTINDEDDWATTYADLFNCQVGTFPIKYLGVPVSPSRLHVADWLPLVDKSAEKLDVWQGSSLSIAGRTTLIRFSLNNAPIYHMSIYLLPKTVLNKLDKLRRFFSGKVGEQNKDSTKGRDVPLIFVLRRWCRDSNPGWLNQPLLWRVVLTSCTVRVLARWGNKTKVSPY